MPGIELHADYDRTGWITRSVRERAERLNWPGVIVVPNMDRDQRSLPHSVGNASLQPADYDLPMPRSRDDELVPLQVRVQPGALSPGERLLIHCSGNMHTRISLYDRSGAIIQHQLGSPEIFELPAPSANGVLDIRLQVKTIAGATFGHTSNLEVTYSKSRHEESHFELTLLRRDAGNEDHVEDHGRFTVSPFILVDRTAPAYRVYIARAGYNWPSYSDFWYAARAAAVPLIDVDVQFTGGDLWLQDQYQHSVMQGVGGWRQLILHLPRLRHNNTNNTVTDNLNEFVDSHYRSRNIGLYRDLWDRVVPVKAADGVVIRPDFRQLDGWMKKIRHLYDALAEINRIGEFANSGWNQIYHDNWVETLVRLENDLRRLQRTITEARNGASAERDSQLSGFATAARQLVNAARTGFSIGQGGRTITSQIAGRATTLTRDTALRLYNKAYQMHSSGNYGGNIESTPPVTGAPLGKIIIGNGVNPDTGAEHVDPDLLRVLVQQKKQPLVEIDTTWLHVGHVDEMMSVVPHGRRRSGFSILHASSAAALEILSRAESRFRAGIPATHSMNVNHDLYPSGILPRLMTDGTSPVTRLLRGKSWVHIHRRPNAGQSRSGSGVQRPRLPPSIYLKLCEAFGSTSASTGINIHNIGIVPGVGPDRRYPADITPTELLWAEQDANRVSCNTVYENQQLEPSSETLKDAFKGVDIIPIPVLFDRIENTRNYVYEYWFNQTSAFTPNMVNMQVLNKHILVPRPYGPRMYPEDAIAVVKGAMKALKLSGNIIARVSNRLIAARRMTRGQYWVERTDEVQRTSSSPAPFSGSRAILARYGGMKTRQDVIDVFKDSFPGASDAELVRRIIQPNRRHFDRHGELKDQFSLFRITDGMVDLFELYMAAVAAELGVRLHFVDSWSYHIGKGEIHCGTNVLRRLRRRGAGATDVWDAPDHEFVRTQSVNFDEGMHINAGGG